MSQQPARGLAATLVIAVLLVGIPGPAHAQSANVGHAPRAASAVKRTVWTIVGAAAGFGLGAWFGLHKFDDATNSDRKVTISAITGAVIGGVAGGFLSRDASPSFVPQRPKPFGTAAARPRLGARQDDALVARIRAVNAREFQLR